MKLSINFFVFLITMLIMLVISEVAIRQFVDSVDYLMPYIEKHPKLNHHIKGFSGGHDEWGFRNLERPKSASIVAIGDSMTYGISATQKDSWPSQLTNISGDKVYNMSLGGYGPIHYLYLLKEKALQLKPRVVIVGFYFGNDFMDVYNIVHSNDHWRSYAYSSIKAITIDSNTFIAKPVKAKLLGGLRDWLSKNSVLYRMITQLNMFNFIRENELKSKAEDIVVFNFDGRKMLFNPDQHSSFMDIRDRRIQEGLGISLRVFSEMKVVTDKNNIRLLVVLIPTKISAYAERLKSAGTLINEPNLKFYIDSEAECRIKLKRYLTNQNIDYLEVLPVFQQAIQQDDIYPLTDGHPNYKGYGILAKQINAYLSKKDSSQLGKI